MTLDATWIAPIAASVGIGVLAFFISLIAMHINDKNDKD